MTLSITVSAPAMPTKRDSKREQTHSICAGLRTDSPTENIPTDLLFQYPLLHKLDKLLGLIKGQVRPQILKPFKETGALLVAFYQGLIAGGGAGVVFLGFGAGQFCAANETPTYAVDTDCIGDLGVINALFLSALNMDLGGDFDFPGTTASAFQFSF
jgi:hypothetical protein